MQAAHGLNLRVALHLDQIRRRYLRAAQAYMLISMPTRTSTIFGVFQLIPFLPRTCNQGLAVKIILGLHIYHAPALRGNSSIHDFAGRWWLELLAILAALVALRSVLVLHVFLRRLGLRARYAYPGN
jgi:hypothetical protein